MDHPIPCVRVILENDDGEILVLKRQNTMYGNDKFTLPGGKIKTGESVEETCISEVKEETDISVTAVVAYLGAFDYASSSGKKTRQFNFLVETEAGDIKLDQNEHSNYFLLNPSDEQFFKLNISNGTKSILLKAEEK